MSDLRNNKIRNLCLAGVLIGLSIILANFKIFQSIALDSMPAFLGAIIINPLVGGAIGVLGHFFSAMFSGFSLTLPMHIIIMVEMFVVVNIFGMLYHKGEVKSSEKIKILAVVLAILLNGPVSIAISGVAAEFIGMMTAMQFIIMMIVPLTLASAVNIILAYALGRILKHGNIKA